MHAQLGDWSIVLRISMVIGVFFAAVALARRSLLSTRINRRLVGLIGVSATGTLIQRVVCVLLGVDERVVLMNNMVLMAMVCVAGGLTVFWGFNLAAAAVMLALICAFIFPGHETLFFAGAGMGALFFSILSWRGWRGDMALKNREEE